MSVKLLVLYPQPDDKATFDTRYAEEHLPLAGKHLARADGLEVLNGLSAADGSEAPYHKIALVSWPDQASFEADLGSEGGQATAAHAVEISTGGPPVMIVCGTT